MQFRKWKFDFSSAEIESKIFRCSEIFEAMEMFRAGKISVGLSVDSKIHLARLCY